MPTQKQPPTTYEIWVDALIFSTKGFKGPLRKICGQLAILDR